MALLWTSILIAGGIAAFLAYRGGSSKIVIAIGFLIGMFVFMLGGGIVNKKISENHWAMVLGGLAALGATGIVITIRG